MSKFTLIFVLIFVIGLFLAISLGTVWGFYLYEIIYFLNPNDRWWSGSLPDLRYSFIVVVVLLLSFSFRRKQYRNNTLKNFPQAKWFLMLLLTYLLVYFVSVAPDYHKSFLLDLTKLYIIMYVAYRILDSEIKIEYALYAYLIGAAYIGFEAYSVGRNTFGRVEGIGTVDAPDANGVAAAMAATVPILIYYFWRKKMAVKFFVAFLGILIVNGLILINSRGAFLASLAGFGYLMSVVVFSNYRLPKQRLMIIFLLVGSITVGLNLTDDVFWERMGTLETASSIHDIDASGGRRMNFWLATFDMLEDHPLGLGIYGFQILSPTYLDESLLGLDYRETSTRAVHSMWFQCLGEIGYLGFIIFIMLVISIFRYSKMAKKHAAASNKIDLYYLIVALEASLISYMVAGSFIDAFRAEIFYWLMVFCIAISSIVLAQENNPDQNA